MPCGALVSRQLAHHARVRFEKANSFQRETKPYIHLENFPKPPRYYRGLPKESHEQGHEPKTEEPKREEARAYAMKVMRMMEFHWGMRRPSVLISITGGASDFKLSSGL